MDVYYVGSGTDLERHWSGRGLFKFNIYLYDFYDEK